MRGLDSYPRWISVVIAIACIVAAIVLGSDMPGLTMFFGVIAVGLLVAKPKDRLP